MAKVQVQIGSAARKELFFALDSASTTGAGKTAASGTMAAYYCRNDTTPTATSIASPAFTEVSSTNMPGVYYLTVPVGAFASGATTCVVMITGTGMAPVTMEYQLVAYNPDNATSLGLTNLDAAITSRMASYTQPSGFLAATFPTTVASTTNITGGTITTVSGNVNGSVNSVSTRVSANTDQWNGVAVTGMPLPTASYTTPPTATAISTQVWSEAIPGSFGAGTAGAKLNSASSAGDPWATTLPGSYASGTAGNILGNRLDVAVSTRSTLTATNVWSEALPGSYTSGQAGFKLNAAGSAADPWATAIPGSYAAGSAGYIIGNNLNATVGSRSTLVATDVWAAATRTLTAGTNIVLSKGTGITGFNDLSSTNVSDAIWGSLVSTYDPTSANTTATFGKAVLKSDQASKNGDVTMYSISGTNGIDVDVHRIANDVTAATNLKAFLNNTSTVTLGGQFNSTGNAAIVDKLLGRNIAGASDGGRTVTEALRILRNKFTASGTTLTVYAENDTTVSWTSTLSTDAAATPITGSDPA